MLLILPPLLGGEGWGEGNLRRFDLNCRVRQSYARVSEWELFSLASSGIDCQERGTSPRATEERTGQARHTGESRYPSSPRLVPISASGRQALAQPRRAGDKPSRNRRSETDLRSVIPAHAGIHLLLVSRATQASGGQAPALPKSPVICRLETRLPATATPNPLALLHGTIITFMPSALLCAASIASGNALIGNVWLMSGSTVTLPCSSRSIASG